MAINGGAINSAAINGGGIAGQAFTIRALVEQTVTFSPVVHTVSFDLEQTVNVFEVFSLSFDVGQTVTAVHTPSFAVSQAVVAIGAADSVKWQAIVTVDGVQVQDLTGEVVIEAGENESRLASFSIKPASGSLDLTTWLGSAVTIDYLDDKGNYRRRFTGVVDEPVYDNTLKIATFNCTSNRTDLLNAKSRQVINNEVSGYWSPVIFDELASNAEYAEDVISTVEATYDSDEFNQFRKVSINSKASPDFSYTESDILNETLSFQLASRDQLLNKVNIDFDFRYSRLRHRERDYTWDFIAAAPARWDAHRNWGEFLQRPTSLLSRAALETAISNTSWLLKATPTHEDLPPGGYYSGIGWTPIQSSVSYERDSNGNLVLDGNGQPVVASRTVTNIQKVYTTLSSWTMAKRFAQTITEAYSVSIQAPQSVSQYGAVERSESRGLSSNYDSRQWEEYTVYSSPTGTLSNNGDYVIDVDDERPDFNAAWNTAEAVARKEIRESHRLNYVDFNILLDPRIDLRHTVYVNTSDIQARGKVARFIERMDINEGSAISEIRLAISKSVGSAPSDSGIAPPSAPTISDASFVPTTKQMFSHFGNSYQSEVLDGSENGFICNYRTPDRASNAVQFYPTMFVVDGEQIGEEDRGERIVDSSQTKEMAIPNELLAVTV